MLCPNDDILDTHLHDSIGDGQKHHCLVNIEDDELAGGVAVGERLL